MIRIEPVVGVSTTLPELSRSWQENRAANNKMRTKNKLLRYIWFRLCLNLIGIKTVASVDSVNQQQACKNTTKIGGNARQERFIDKQVRTQPKIKQRHGSAEN